MVERRPPLPNPPPQPVMSHSVHRRSWAAVRAAMIAALIVCALSRCGMQQTMRDLLAFQQGLVRTYQEPAIGVHVTNSILTITFQNSKRASLPDAERAAFARQVAEFTRDHYSGYAQLSRVQVGFMTAHQYGPLTTSRSDVPYSYTVTDLGPAAHAPDTAATATRAAAPD